MKSYFLTTLIQYKLFLVLKRITWASKAQRQYSKIEGVPESAKRILHCRQPLKSLASADQELIGLC